jgi:uncharacterized membrane protein YkgB
MGMKILINLIKIAIDALAAIVIVWAAALVTLIVFRITTPEAIANADVSYWGVIMAIITLVTVPIHWAYKKRQAAKNCEPCEK